MLTAPEHTTKFKTSSNGGQAFMPPVVIQKKLEIGSSDDKYEVEADRMADQVLQMKPVDADKPRSTKTSIQRKCTNCEEEERIRKKPLSEQITPLVQRRTSGSEGGRVASGGINTKINQSKGNGRPLGGNAKNTMESGFGTDFSGVRVHTDSNATNLSQELNAQAFTVGNDIYFNEGKYNPNSHSGKHLLAHELTHTVQQRETLSTKKIQRQCLTTTPDNSETPFVYQHNGNPRIAEFSDEGGASRFIRRHPDKNLTCHQITRGNRTIYKIYQRNSTTTTASTTTTPNSNIRNEIFANNEVERMRDFFIDNTRAASPLACINTVRAGVGSLVFDNTQISGVSCPSQLTMTANNQMDETMTQLVNNSMASDIGTVKFLDSRGQIIPRGSGREPMNLESSIWTLMTTNIGSNLGWSVFGLSICDGTHSVLMTVDHRDLSNIKMFWSDQTHNHPVQRRDRIRGRRGRQYGWERMLETGNSSLGNNPRGVDSYIRYAIRSFWGLTATEARGTVALTTVQRRGRSLGSCFPQVSIWRIRRP